MQFSVTQHENVTNDMATSYIYRGIFQKRQENQIVLSWDKRPYLLFSLYYPYSVQWGLLQNTYVVSKLSTRRLLPGMLKAISVCLRLQTTRYLEGG